MALAHDAVSSLQWESGTPQTVSHTTTGSDRFLFVVVAWDRDGVVGDGSVTYNSVNMPLVFAYAHAVDRPMAEVFGLVAPATGSNTISVTVDTDPKSQMNMMNTSYTGVDQSTPLGTFSTANDNATPMTVDVASTTSGNLVVDFGWLEDAGIQDATVGASQTGRIVQGATGLEMEAGTSDEAASGTITMSWTVTEGTRWATAAVELLIASAGSDTEITGIIDTLVIAEGTGNIVRNHVITGIIDELVVAEGTGTVDISFDIAGILDALVIAEGTGDIVRNHAITGVTDALVIAEGTGDIVRNHVITGILDALVLTEGLGTVDVSNDTTVTGIIDALVIAEGTGDIVRNHAITGIIDALVIAEGTGTVDIAFDIAGIIDALVIAEGTGDIVRNHAITGITDALVIAEGTGNVVSGICAWSADAWDTAVWDDTVWKFCPETSPTIVTGITDALVLTEGLGSIAFEDLSQVTKGGTSREAREKELRRRENVAREAAAELFFDSIFGKESSVEITGSYKRPTLPTAPDLRKIKDDVVREIAELNRVLALEAFEKEVLRMEEDLKQLEEELVAILVLTEDEHIGAITLNVG